MNEKLLTTERLPARVNADQVAALLGMQASDIQILARSRLLKPLGNPARNGSKYFATCMILRLAEDERWLARASDAIVAHHHQRNHGGEE
ncbi:MAG: Uncharacterized protein FD161_1807 [Limisphaerales bacterium]|nr:MAG: Uncharacterized protein FD161_1807 [Limisphaerales bacterium]TXT47777.1 MAG: Uncharacterized protein FD140_4050 [Limisphaerales bacterium]